VRRYQILHCPVCGEALLEAVAYGAPLGAHEPIRERGYEYRCPRVGCRFVERHERRAEARA